MDNKFCEDLLEQARLDNLDLPDCALSSEVNPCILANIILCCRNGIPNKYIIPISVEYLSRLSICNKDLLYQLDEYISPSGTFILDTEVVERLILSILRGTIFQKVKFNMMPLSKVDIICNALDDNIRIENCVLQNENMLLLLVYASKLGYEPDYVIKQGYNEEQLRLLLMSNLPKDKVFSALPASISARTMLNFLPCIRRGIDISDVINAHKTMPLPNENLDEIAVALMNNCFDRVMLLPNLTVDQLVRLEENFKRK